MDPNPESGNGVAISGSDQHWWAWYGVEIEAAVDLTQLASYQKMERTAAQQVLQAADRSYLGAQLQQGGGVCEMRWMSSPATGRARLYMLGRLHAASPAAAAAAGLSARQRLLAVPHHVTARAIANNNELLAVLLPPSEAIDAEEVELRKRWVVERTQRSDARWPFYVSVPWLRDVPAADWSPLIQTLARSPEGTMVSISIEEVPVSRDLTRTISMHAAEYRRLSQPGEKPGLNLYDEGRAVAPDPGAINAAAIFDDAVQRYPETAFTMRVTVASTSTTGAQLAAQLREIISPAESAESSFKSAQLAGSALEFARPRDANEVAIIRRNLQTLGQTPWASLGTVEPAAAKLINSLDPLGRLVDLREAANLIRLPYSLDGRLTGFRIVRPIVEGPAADQAAGDLLLGYQGEGTAGPITIPLASLTSHTLVVGSTGSGKTSSVLNLLEQAWVRHGIPFLVIEPVNSDRNDYRWLVERPGFEDMLVLTVGDESLAPFRLNPFEVPPGVRIGTHIASLVTCFDAAFGLTGPLPFLYRKAIKLMYTKAGIATDEISGARHRGRWPRLADLTQVFAELPDIERYAGEVRSNISAASRLRSESLLNGSCGRTLDARSSYPLADLLSRPVVLELAAVGDDDREQALMIAFLLNSLTAFYKATRTTSELQHLTVIEEAHRLLRRPRPVGEDGDQSARAAEQFANTLAENRKYGEGLIIVEQVPSKLIEDAHKNTATKIMHHLPSSDDRDAIAATMNLSEDQETYARALEPMTAYVTHRGMGGQAGLVHVPNIRAHAAAAQNRTEEPLPGHVPIRQRFEGFAHDRADLWADLAPYDECATCNHRCQFRGIGEVLAPPRAKELRVALRARTYPPPGPDREARWAEIAAEYKNIADSYTEYDSGQREDLAYCAFLHSAMAAFPGRSVKGLALNFRKASSGRLA